MLHQPTKYHSNPLSHFLGLHSATSPSSITVTATNTSGTEHNECISDDVENSNTTPLDVVNGNIGKSFTIAAILGLKKNAAAVAAAAAAASVNDNNNRNFSDVMNLSLNQSTNKNLNSYESDRLITAAAAAAAATNGTNLGRLSSGVSLAQHYPHNNNHLHQHHHHQHHQQQHPGTSALQSLQQLHQHHTASGNITFHTRERNRNENSTKKSQMKSKRVRTIFTPEQLERLEAEFERQQYMVGPERLYLAHTLQLTEAQVKVWFQNRRIKWRKHHLELTQQRLAILRQRQISSNGGVSSQPPINSALSESELGICSDSLDAGSVQDDDT